MPVRRLSSLDDAEDTAWRDPDGPLLWSAIRAVWDLSIRLSPRRFPPGVYKHKSIEDANRATEAWERERKKAP